MVDSKMKRSKARTRRNFLLTLLIATSLWAAVAGIIYFAEPEVFGAVPLFFSLVFFAILFTASLLFGNKRRGLITTISLTLFLLLRYFGIGNILNFLLLAGLAITIEFYLSRS